ncbi:MAG: pyruvate kinase [Chlamydiae bacterium]|nr:pyruvate kinase [Chlamydiota bacterium]
MHRRTKIICTIGPAVSSYEQMLKLIDAGMNVARLNFSHGTQQEHKKVIDNLKKARSQKRVPLAIMLDTKGPEIRVGKIKNDALSLNPKQKLSIFSKEVIGDERGISITPGFAIHQLEPGHLVLFDDGYIISKVVETKKEEVVIEIQNPGILKSQKGVNIPSVNIDLPAMTEKDKEDLQFGCREDVDLIAASFIRSAQHVLEIKKLLSDLKKPEILVIAKIENRLGVQNFDSVLQVADGIMVARGDLGVELPLNQVPVLQKMMIRKCIQAAKTVVIATQMLESMIKNPRPTRAEVSDVANAIYDSTSAVMLSGETAMGNYPIEAVEMMRGIIEETEKDFQYKEFFYHHFQKDSHDISSSISLASVKTAYSSGAKAIFVFTSTGFTGRLISGFRPAMPIVALTPNPKTYQQLSIFWGTIPADPVDTANAREAFEITSRFSRKKKIVEYGDLIVMTAGSPFGISGTTNMMIVESIGEVLVRGHPGRGKKVSGHIAIFLTDEEISPNKAKDSIIVLPHYIEQFLPLLKVAKGVILQNHPEDAESEKLLLAHAENLHIAYIIRADRAINQLHAKQFVVLDPEKGIVYKEVTNNYGEEELIPAISDPKD